MTNPEQLNWNILRLCLISSFPPSHWLFSIFPFPNTWAESRLAGIRKERTSSLLSIFIMKIKAGKIYASKRVGKFISILPQWEKKNKIALTKNLFGGRMSSSDLLLTLHWEVAAFTSFLNQRSAKVILWLLAMDPDPTTQFLIFHGGNWSWKSTFSIVLHRNGWKREES